MATETTKTDKTEKTDAKATETEEEKTEATGVSEPEDAAKSEDVSADDDVEGDDVLADDHYDHDIEPDHSPGLRGSGLGAGAAAVVSAALGVCSLTGTSLSEMLRERKQLVGQIESSSQAQGGGGGASDQIEAMYGAPWHAAALLNGIFALLAVAVGGVLLAMVVKRADTRSWVKSFAIGGVILGLIGLLVAAGMYLDLFASAPKVPGQPT
jgi:hypothetical protein